MTLADLFEFSQPRASVVWPVNKPGQDKRVEKTATKVVAGRKTFMVRKATDV